MLGQENIRPEFKDIKGYVAKELKETSVSLADAKPVILFDSSRREVIIKTFDPNLKGKKVYNIPLPQEKEKFQQSWVDVFIGCFEYIRERLHREGAKIFENGNSVIIDNKTYTFNNYAEYIAILEKELNDYIAKKKNKHTPIVNIQSVKISMPEDNKPKFKSDDINNMVAKRQLAELIKGKKPKQENETKPIIEKEEKEIVKEKIVVPVEKETNPIVNAKLTATFPEGKYPIVKDTIKEELTEKETNYDMHQQEPEQVSNLNDWVKPINQNVDKKEEVEKQKQENPKSRKITNYKKLKKLQSRFCGAITDEEPLTLSDCSLLRDKSFVLVSGSVSKTSEIIFYDNIELIQENINIPIGAFIVGKGKTPAKILKEIKDINNMCKSGITAGIICYEPNYQALQETDNQELIETIGAIKQLTEILEKEYEYTPMLCMDLDSKKAVDSVNINFNCPTLLRVSSKELDNVDENSDIVIMHPDFDYDQLSVTDKTAEYIQNAINNNLEVQKTSSK